MGLTALMTVIVLLGHVRAYPVHYVRILLLIFATMLHVPVIMTVLHTIAAMEFVINVQTSMAFIVLALHVLLIVNVILAIVLTVYATIVPLSLV
jgi:hypothetical protein